MLGGFLWKTSRSSTSSQNEKKKKVKKNQTHVLFLVLLNVVLVWVVLFSGIYDPGGGLLGKRNNSFWFPRPAPYEEKKE